VSYIVLVNEPRNQFTQPRTISSITVGLSNKGVNIVVDVCTGWTTYHQFKYVNGELIPAQGTPQWLDRSINRPLCIQGCEQFMQTPAYRIRAHNVQQRFIAYLRNTHFDDLSMGEQELYYQYVAQGIITPRNEEEL